MEDQLWVDRSIIAECDGLMEVNLRCMEHSFGNLRAIFCDKIWHQVSRLLVWNISTAIRLIAMEYCTEVGDSQRMKPNDFNDSLINL